MRAIDEVDRLVQELQSGNIHPEEPLFVLRARDVSASILVRFWIMAGRLLGIPGSKLDEAGRCANAMDEWNLRRVPGRPETEQRVDHLVPNPLDLTVEDLYRNQKEEEFPPAPDPTIHKPNVIPFSGEEKNDGMS